MASLRRVSSKDTMTCFLCERLFTDPVSAPCGHHFCRTCITLAWDINTTNRCPKCKKEFSSRPELTANHTLSDQISELKHCKKHKQPLEKFCRSDETLLCSKCMDHKGHNVVPLKEEADKRRSSLNQKQAQMKKMVKQRHDKEKELRNALIHSQRAIDKETTAGLQAFSALIQSVQRRQQEFIEELQEQHKHTQTQAQELISELQQEICELEKTSSELEQLSKTEDHLHFIQRHRELRPAADRRDSKDSKDMKDMKDMKDWSTVSFETRTYEGSAARALSELEESLTQQLTVFKAKLMELKDLQEFVVEVTLDPDTAAPRLVLSEDLKQVHDGGMKKDLPNNSQRFSVYPNVLGKQSFTSGKFYFEVQVKEKTRWSLGVAQESVERNRPYESCPKEGVWSIGLCWGDRYYSFAGPRVPLSLEHPPQKVGVFVDYGGGQVSFYDVDTKNLIYCFTGCCFREKIFPFLCPGSNYGGENSTPLILTKVTK